MTPVPGTSVGGENQGRAPGSTEKCGLNVLTGGVVIAPAFSLESTLAGAATVSFPAESLLFETRKKKNRRDLGFRTRIFSPNLFTCVPSEENGFRVNASI